MVFIKKKKLINPNRNFFLKITLQELLNRNFFLGKEALQINKKITKFFLGKRNNFFIINTEISLYSLKKSINCISDLFCNKITSQAFFYFGYESTEYFLLKKNLIEKTNIEYAKKDLKNKFFNVFSPFPRQIYFLGKWKSGSISNFFIIMSHIFFEFEKNYSLYKTHYPQKKILTVFESFVKKDYKFFFKKLTKIFEKIVTMNLAVKDKSAFFLEQDFKYVKIKKNIPYFLKKKLPISRLFFKKDNFFLLEGLPEIIITLSKNEILNFESHFMKIFNIGIIDPEKKMFQVDFVIPGNSSRALLLLYLKIFRSSIFLGRFQKMQNFFFKKNHKNIKVFHALKIRKVISFFNPVTK